MRSSINKKTVVGSSLELTNEDDRPCLEPQGQGSQNLSTYMSSPELSNMKQPSNLRNVKSLQVKSETKKPSVALSKKKTTKRSVDMSTGKR